MVMLRFYVDYTGSQTLLPVERLCVREMHFDSGKTAGYGCPSGAQTATGSRGKRGQGVGLDISATVVIVFGGCQIESRYVLSAREFDTKPKCNVQIIKRLILVAPLQYYAIAVRVILEVHFKNGTRTIRRCMFSEMN